MPIINKPIFILNGFCHFSSSSRFGPFFSRKVLENLGNKQSTEKNIWKIFQNVMQLRLVFQLELRTFIWLMSLLSATFFFHYSISHLLYVQHGVQNGLVLNRIRFNLSHMWAQATRHTFTKLLIQLIQFERLYFFNIWQFCQPKIWLNFCSALLIQFQWITSIILFSDFSCRIFRLSISLYFGRPNFANQISIFIGKLWVCNTHWLFSSFIGHYYCCWGCVLALLIGVLKKKMPFENKPRDPYEMMKMVVHKNNLLAQLLIRKKNVDFLPLLVYWNEEEEENNLRHRLGTMTTTWHFPMLTNLEEKTDSFSILFSDIFMVLITCPL